MSVSEREMRRESDRVLDREDLESAEERELASYACRSGRTRGRLVAEPPDALRTHYQRDRDRIIHSTAFRRLLGKTQVFVSDTGDHYRVRLTHSLEVSQIARSISRSLALNQDLTEGLALAHDLGHPPFGHSGGEVLHELMRDHGGFEHNRQALRIVDRLEHMYPAFRGLNLTYEFRESIIKHKRPYEGPAYEPFSPRESPVLEAQVVDLADGIAYNSHDLDDGLASGILDEEDLEEVSLWRRVRYEARGRYPDAQGIMLNKKSVALLINLLVKNLVNESARRLEEHGIRSLKDVRACREDLIGFDPELREEEIELRRFLYERFYTHHKVARMRHRARVVIEGLFDAYRRNATLMPQRYRDLADEEGIERAVSDYIAGMTDRYAQKEYAILFNAGGDLQRT